MATRPSRGPKKEIDPEELMRRKFKALCKFRAFSRLVMANAHWLNEDIEQYEGVDNVKRRVAQAVRTISKQKQLLNVNDKSLLNKPAMDRTEHEKQYLYRIIGGLKCFKRYPNHVKRKLAAVTYFKYYGPGRVIVRQHHEAHAMYFLVDGDVTVSQTIYDELLQRNVSIEVDTMHPGEMFGEISLLHSVPRTSTVTTITHCELLVLMKEDFKSVLQASVQKQWDEVRSAMSYFTYFDALDDVARREGCIVAKLRSYETNETIFGDGIGIPNSVYFVLSGRCQMIESLKVQVRKHLGNRCSYTLYDPYVPKVESEEDFDKKYFNLLKDKSKTDMITPTEPEAILSGSSKSETTVAAKRSSIKRTSAFSQVPGISHGEKATDSAERSRTSSAEETDEQQSGVILAPDEKAVPPSRASPSVRLSVIPEIIAPTQIVPLNLRTYFMQVCLMNPGSSFGFGENMRDRRIVALTPVRCMLFPKIWLLQRNTANIWTRIQHYLEKKIPTKKQLFKEFVSIRRWQEYSNELMDGILASNNTVNWTSIHDVPYSIRMEEMLDIAYS